MSASDARIHRAPGAPLSAPARSHARGERDEAGHVRKCANVDAVRLRARHEQQHAPEHLHEHEHLEPAPRARVAGSRLPAPSRSAGWSRARRKDDLARLKRLIAHANLANRSRAFRTDRSYGRWKMPRRGGCRRSRARAACLRRASSFRSAGANAASSTSPP